MGIEDEIKIEDVLKERNEIILAKIYIQALKTNGKIKDHGEDIGKIEVNIATVETKLEDKIGFKAFQKIAIIATAIISIMMILSSIVGILNLVIGR